LKRISTVDGQDRLRTFLDLNREPLGGSNLDSYLKKVRLGSAYPSLLSYLIQGQHAQEVDFHNGGVEIRYARIPSNQLRLWIQDADDAAFSFDHQPEAGDETEISFRTHDTSLSAHLNRFLRHAGAMLSAIPIIGMRILNIRPIHLVK
jgi:hypothetical protein